MHIENVLRKEFANNFGLRAKSVEEHIPGVSSSLAQFMRKEFHLVRSELINRFGDTSHGQSKADKWISDAHTVLEQELNITMFARQIATDWQTPASVYLLRFQEDKQSYAEAHQEMPPSLLSYHFATVTYARKRDRIIKNLAEKNKRYNLNIITQPPFMYAAVRNECRTPDAYRKMHEKRLHPLTHTSVNLSTATLSQLAARVKQKCVASLTKSIVQVDINQIYRK